MLSAPHRIQQFRGKPGRANSGSADGALRLHSSLPATLGFELRELLLGVARVA
jgi:hypothetical protein